MTQRSQWSIAIPNSAAPNFSAREGRPGGAHLRIRAPGARSHRSLLRFGAMKRLAYETRALLRRLMKRLTIVLEAKAGVGSVACRLRLASMPQHVR